MGKWLLPSRANYHGWSVLEITKLSRFSWKKSTAMVNKLFQWLWQLVCFVNWYSNLLVPRLYCIFVYFRFLFLFLFLVQEMPWLLRTLTLPSSQDTKCPPRNQLNTAKPTFKDSGTAPSAVPLPSSSQTTITETAFTVLRQDWCILYFWTRTRHLTWVRSSKSFYWMTWERSTEPTRLGSSLSRTVHFIIQTRHIKTRTKQLLWR